MAGPTKKVAEKTFAALFRTSKFVEMGDPNGKVVIGKIVRSSADDLYIDFGGKFNCVCRRPPVDPQLYTIGRLVRLRLHDLELSTRFLGSDIDLTVCEADATLLGLHRTKADAARHRKQEESKLAGIIDLKD